MTNDKNHVSRFRFHAPALTSLVILAALYLIALLLLPPDALTHHDEGAKYLQVRNLRITPTGLDWSINYPARRLDPQLQFVPFHPKQHYIDSQGRIYLQWPIFLGLLTRVFWKVLGFWGLYVVPLFAGIATLWVSYLLALAIGLPGRTAWLVIPTVGLGTPMPIYSLLYFEHTLAALLVALSILAAIVGLRRTKGEGQFHLMSFALRPSSAAALSGALLAVAVYFRSELYVLALVTALVYTYIGWRWNLWRLPVAWIAAFALMLVPLWAFYAISEGSLLPAHALWYFAGGEPSNSGGIPRPGLPPLRYIASAGWSVIPAFLFGPPASSTVRFVPMPAEWVGLAELAGIGFCAVAALGKLASASFALAWRMSALVLGLALLLVSTAATLFLSQDYRNLHGFLLASPFVALALWPASRTRDEGPKTNDTISPSSFVPATTLLYIALHALVISALSGLGPISLHEWGQRYLLPAYPLLAVVALFSAHDIWMGAHRRAIRNLAVACVAIWIALALVGLGFTVRGYVVLSEERAQVAGWQALMRTLPPKDPLVTNVWWLPLNLADDFYSRPMMLAEGDDQLVQWAKQMQARGVTHFGFATNDPTIYKTFEGQLPNAHADGPLHQAQGIWLQQYKF